MKKRIMIDLFADENGDTITIGGAKNCRDFARNYGHQPYETLYRVVDVPGLILGTTDDWDMIFRQNCRAAVKED